MHDVYNENYKTLLKEIEDVPGKCRYILFMEVQILVTGQVSPNWSSGSMEHKSKISADFCLGRNYLADFNIYIHGNTKSWKSRYNFEKEKQSWRTDFKTYYKTTVEEKE